MPLAQQVPFHWGSEDYFFSWSKNVTLNISETSGKNYDNLSRENWFPTSRTLVEKSTDNCIKMQRAAGGQRLLMLAGG